MKIGITGIERKLGREIANQLLDCITIDESLTGLSECDVFINNLCKGNIQEIYFSSVYNLWSTLPKTIINIISTVVFDEVNTLGSYGESKINLHNLVNDTIAKNPNKAVRIINVYPSTLSSNKHFDNLNKVDIVQIASLIKTVVNLPQELEVRDIRLYPTVRDREFNKTTLL